MQGQAQTQTCKNISLTKKQMEVRIAPGGAGSNSQGLSPRPNPAKNSFNKKTGRGVRGVTGGCAEKLSICFLFTQIFHSFSLFFLSQFILSLCLMFFIHQQHMNFPVAVRRPSRRRHHRKTKKFSFLKKKQPF
jgi:hypothetical protein